MEFKYFEKPEIHTVLRESGAVCDICTEAKPCFDARVFYGEEEIDAICPTCLASGKLLQKNISTCEGDIDSLISQLKQLHPDWTDEHVQDIAEQKTVELETTTPHIVTWQDWQWPCADGDYCRFIGYGSRPLYIELAGNAPAEQFFRESFYDPADFDDDLWDRVLPGKAVKDFRESSKYGSLFYVFRSLHSDRIITIWDTN